jgi:hypothetical protein
MDYLKKSSILEFVKLLTHIALKKKLLRHIFGLTNEWDGSF